ncbi:MAG: hypothetical protein KGH75_00355 [Rhodospirillales bacterium]|nr:hypothetical protein [Rhodospirillales bacterium]
MSAVRRHIVVKDGARWLVVDLPRSGVKRHGLVVAEASAEMLANRVRIALDARYPGAPDDAEDTP